MNTIGIIIGVIVALVLYLIIDFITMGEGKGVNDFFDRWALKILWIWLPFFALYTLTKELIVRSQSKR